MKHTHNVLAIDIGYGNTKMVCDYGIDRMGRPRWSELIFPSIAPAAVMDEAAAGLGFNPDRILFEIDGRRYYAGPRATSGVETRIIEPDYIETDLHEVMLRAALHFAMRETKKVIHRVEMLALGLPVSGYAQYRNRLFEIGKQSRTVPVPQQLQASAGAAAIEVSIDRVMVYPQPWGGLRLAGQNLPSSDSIFDNDVLSMVVDPGYRTMDWFVASGLSPEMRLSGSYDGGVSSILRDVSQQIGFDHGTGSLEFDLIEQGLSSGQINLGHTVIEMAPYKEMAEALAEKEIGTLATRMGSRRSNLARLFLAGGGASFYEQAIRNRFTGCEVITLEESVMANARGYWLSGLDELSDLEIS